MRSSRRAMPEIGGHSETGLAGLAARHLAGAVGFAVMGLVALVALALATWTVTDPSLSHATAHPAKNLIGYPGAVVADLMMQLFGMAAPIALLPALVLGWRLTASGSAQFSRGRAVTWVGFAFAAALALAGLAVPEGWPLPLGLGGVVGDMVLKPVALIFGETTRLAAGIGGGGLALILLVRTLTPAPPSRLRPSDVALRGRDRDEDGDDDDGLMPLALAHHWLLVIRANIMRLVGRRPAALDARRHGLDLRRGLRQRPVEDDEPPFDDDDVRPVMVRGRREPVMAESRARPTPRVAAPPVMDDEPDYDDGADAIDDEAVYDLRPAPAARAPEPVYTPAPRAEPRPEPRAEPRPEPRAERRAPARAPEPVYVPEPEPVDDAYDDDLDDDPMPAADEPARRVTVGKQAKPLEQARRNKPTPSHHDAREAVADGYQFPALNLLAEPKRLGPNAELTEEVLEGNAGMLEGVLDDFGIKGEIIHVRPGPVVTLYELRPAPGVKSSRVIGLADDIARSMSAVSARVAVVPGHNVIGIELPNQRRETVYLREMIASPDFQQSKHRLAISLGKTIGGEAVIVDLARMPHLLVAGTTGSGKSVAINTMIMSLLYRLTPEECKLIMIDPKMLELSVYDGIPHLLTPVVTDPKKAVVALKWTVKEMEDRYRKMSKLGVRNIDGYNARVGEAKASGEVLTREVQTGFHRQTGEPIYEMEELALESLPYIVVVVDEMADLMMVAGKEIEGAIQRLAQMARAAGIHIVMATQRPSVDVITGTIKANFPTRISFQVTSKIDSRTILGEQGAEQLLGQGDMLYMQPGGRIQRVHGPFISDGEVEKIVHHLKRQGAPQYLEAITSANEDEEAEADGDAGGLEESNDLYDKAVAVVLRDKKASTSYIQRRLQIGYNRAASLIERMEREGLISAPGGTGKREILVDAGDR